MDKKEMMDFKNQQYITNKMMEIQMEGIRLEIERKNQEIADNAVDSYTEELMAAGLL